MAGAKKSPRGGHKPPEGKVRLSQVVMTFGPGAMVDLLDHAVIVGGTDFWRYDKYKDPGFIDEPRLRDAVVAKVGSRLGIELSVNRAFRSPPAGDDDAPSAYNGIQVAEFPSWFVCQHCRALGTSKNLEREKGRYVHHCTNTHKGVCVPVRFVATCKRGHLDEFPWNWFVHPSQESRCDVPDLYLQEDASGDFAHILVRCRACGAERKLSEARESKVLPQCRGERPWLGPEGREEKGCEEKLSLLVRTASSGYFAQWMSALSIPDKAREIMNKVSQSDVWNVVQEAKREQIPLLRQVVPAVRNALRDMDDDQVFAAIETIRKGKAPAREGLRTAEYKVFFEAKDEVDGQLPPRDDDFFACRLPPKRYPLPPMVSRIVLAKKVRQVRAQIGLTRLSATPLNLQGETEDPSNLQPLGLMQTWLPAAEIFGEGVLICLDEEQVRRWEDRDAVKRRAGELEQGYRQEFKGGSKGPGFPGARFYLLHSLSHLLMSSISLQCGYSASALSERIYCAPASDDLPMAAVFIMTGTSGAEGTLGGLVEQGRFIRRHLRRAWDMASLCSSDPVCAHHSPRDQSGRYLEGAACHGCLFVAEPACERFNRYLDRALVVPAMGHDPELAFFQVRP
ncbi:DrmB family protein [Sorangium sp. So ce861]|uniref:DrmB family protein n=1 Tax=Sorangium sp. So ce861 TaxID=3133323 RepID=UPI003F5D7C58